MLLQINVTAKGLGIVEWSAIISAGATIVYTAGTFLLWKNTKKSIDLTRAQMKRNEDVLQQSAIQTVYKNFRDLYSMILNNQNDANTLAATQGIEVEKLREKYLGSFLINHAYEIFCLYQRNLIPKDFWERVVRDMKVLFSWQFIYDRWKEVRILYPHEFQIFIDDNIILPISSRSSN